MGFLSALARRTSFGSRLTAKCENTIASNYLRIGFSALDSILRFVPGWDARAPQSVLDFGCGYGRVLRIIRAAWPAAAITACDLMPGGLRLLHGAF